MAGRTLGAASFADTSAGKPARHIGPPMTASAAKKFSRAVLALFFAAAGMNHFVSVSVYREIMPPYWPWPLELVYLSGIAETVLGLGVLIPRFRRVAGWGLIALLCAVF